MELEPNRLIHHVELGRCMMKLGMLHEAQSELEVTVEILSMQCIYPIGPVSRSAASCQVLFRKALSIHIFCRHMLGMQTGMSLSCEDINAHLTRKDAEKLLVELKRQMAVRETGNFTYS